MLLSVSRLPYCSVLLPVVSYENNCKCFRPKLLPVPVCAEYCQFSFFVVHLNKILELKTSGTELFVWMLAYLVEGTQNFPCHLQFRGRKLHKVSKLFRLTDIASVPQSVHMYL